MKRLIIILLVWGWMMVGEVGAIETGGTDYVVYERSTKKASVNPAPYPQWTTDHDQDSDKTVLGSYDLNPEKVKNQLQEMCNNGQRKIGLTLYYFLYDEAWNIPAAERDWVRKDNWNGSLPSVLVVSGQPTERLIKNIQGVVRDIKATSLANGGGCYNEIQFRFAPVANANARSWSAWDEAKYQANWNFIVAVRKIVKEAVGGGSGQLYFDLAAEEGGLGEGLGQVEAYTTRLWKDYVLTYGAGDSYGFSVAWSPGRIGKLIEILDRSGSRPPKYAVDIYEEGGVEAKNQLEEIYQELSRQGEGQKGVIIQETYHSDRNILEEVVATEQRLGMNIATVMQWQMARGDLDNWKIDPTYLYVGAEGGMVGQGDANNDQKVDLLDFSIWKQEYLKRVNTLRADFNNDQKVDLLDFVIWKRDF